MSGKKEVDNKDKFYYLTVVFDERYKSKKFHYLSNDLTISAGDYVIVDSFGDNKVVKVIKAAFYTKTTAPYPYHLTKQIISKADKLEPIAKEENSPPIPIPKLEPFDYAEWYAQLEAEEDIDKMPKAIQQLAKSWSCKFFPPTDYSKSNNPSPYYLKHANITFKYKGKWYRFTPSAFGTNDDIFVAVSEYGLEQALQKLGAEKVNLSSQID